MTDLERDCDDREDRAAGRQTGVAALFSPLRLREVTFRNRIVIAPMQMYAAGADGIATDWHFQHLAKFAVGGAGAIFTEGLAIEPEGRATYADLGIWSDSQIPALRRTANFISSAGGRPCAQLHHAGPRASRRRPWDGLGPLTEDDAAIGEAPWTCKSASAQSFAAGWPTPHAVSIDEIKMLVDRFAAAARRCDEAGFDAVEVHAGHDYLIHSFLSPAYNFRQDGYGGSLDHRMRLAIEIAEAVRQAWPRSKPLFFRISCLDRPPGPWSLDDAAILARELCKAGVDLIDCSSSGTNDPRRDKGGKASPARGFQVPFARHVRHSAGVPTMAVGLILDGRQAAEIIEDGSSDLVAIGREALVDPHWPLRAAREIGVDPNWELWPRNYGFWLAARERAGVAPAEPHALPRPDT